MKQIILIYREREREELSKSNGFFIRDFLNFVFMCVESSFIPVPTEAPQNFTLVQVISSTSASLRWNPVNPATVNGHFEGYKVNEHI